ncbi:MAG TPA: YihY/virulence factor BrkB family protein [Edaphocola sp.]|nr:YihY/virulence factor BrkB family protein [Edaphocola sp.]
MRQRISAKGIWEVMKNMSEGFIRDKVTKLSGALAYYTVFSMGPLFIIIISLCSLFFKREIIEGKVYNILQDFLGKDNAGQLENVINNAAIDGKSTTAVIIGIVFLLIGATTVFAVIQDAINGIWGIKPKPKNGIIKILKDRFLSFSIIVSLGFLLLVSLAITGIIETLSENLQLSFPGINILIVYIINLVATLAISTLIFATIFKVLPDAQIRWKDVFVGALVTACLFMAGKFGISTYIAQTNVGSTYGAAGSLVVLLVWIYYSSIILYLGAEFTKAYAIKYGAEIRPNEYAVTIKKVVEETNSGSIQENSNRMPDVPAHH